MTNASAQSYQNGLFNVECKRRKHYHAQAWGIRMLQKFAVTLAQHRRGILAYYDCPIITGPLEGTNNKIKTMQRQAYGFRDPDFFKLKVFALHETTYALVG
ncbi:MAG TPA: transposase [Tepidisphaeraceae bacterium]|nr:transposase [Tepidisphaeraceae bacterium]